MRIGLSSPIVVQHPSTTSEWERSAGIAELARVAEAADGLGFHHLTCSEHVAVPVDVAQERGGTYWDPLATLGYLAARTRQVRLTTTVLVLGYHHPLEIAKRYGTLDVVSGGRLVLGLGVGTLREEFELLDAPFSGRGARADDALRALRASLSQPEPSYHGEHYSYEGFLVSPHAQQARVPLWIGGRTPRSLRRAIEHGDGWVPFGLGLRELTELLGAAELPPQLEVVLSPGRQLDPLGAPDACATALSRLRDAGATVVSVAIDATGAQHYCDQLHALRELAEPLGARFTPPTEGSLDD
ncbi:LLM class F420-dependent oxidoreductase [Rhodococcus sp. X156]|uniref:LLM class F420-dependent oxidoreductase n=1 Tax=Rhodococcus sp. X156 TaxID=2499145 RepID=UPI000FD7195B|nr:LLM class F420-dependent oxidoreductase [Rhodococcus sp. X156]